MLVQPTSASFASASTTRSPMNRQVTAASPANIADTVHISSAAREALASSLSSTDSDTSVEARLAEIRAREPVNRPMEDQEYLFAHDKRLAGIAAQGKSPDELSADDLDYMQKATGLVNTMANLSPSEKHLYDQAVASGNKEAAAGIGQIALIRMMGHTAGGANNTTYDPLSTEITAPNIGKFFSHSIVDPSGKAQKQFSALIQYLQNNSASLTAMPR